MSEFKTLRRHFSISDFEEEQDFLTSFHSDGWRLLSVKGNKYIFEKCERNTVSYKIDFNPNERQRDEYIQFVVDFGWQFIAERNGRFYFSKPTSLYSENECKLFSDRSTKALMCRKIVNRKLLRLIPLSAVMVFVSFLIGFTLFTFHIAPLFLAAFISVVLLSGLILALYASYLTSFIKLKRIMKDDYQVESHGSKASQTAALVILSLIALIGGLLLNFESFVFGGYTVENAIVTTCVILLWCLLFALGYKNYRFMLYTSIYLLLTFIGAIISWVGVYTGDPLAINLLLFVPTSGALSGFGFLFSNNLLAIGAIILTSVIAISLSFMFLIKIQKQQR